MSTRSNADVEPYVLQSDVQRIKLVTFLFVEAAD